MCSYLVRSRSRWGFDKEHILIGPVCIFTMLLLCVIGAGQGPTPCPSDNATLATWCTTQFGSGGVLTANVKEDGSFVCMCNNVIPLAVSRVFIDSVKATCSWNGIFDSDTPSPDKCYAVSGTCPTSCSALSNRICDAEQGTCTGDGAAGYSYTCNMCDGQTFSLKYADGVCKKSMDRIPLCNPATTCNGHGCCVYVDPNDYEDNSPCRCYDSDSLGHYTGKSCEECAVGYQRNTNGLCTVAKPRIEVILSSIAKTWTMVLPNMAVIFLFVVCGLARRPWESETTFELTALRRANLSAVQLERRGRQSLFHSKYVPKRPAKSRSFANDTREERRGLSAY